MALIRDLVSDNTLKKLYDLKRAITPRKKKVPSAPKE